MYNGQMNDCLGCKWNVFCTHQSATLIPFILLDAVEALYRDMSAKGVLFSMPPPRTVDEYANAVNSTDLVWSRPVRDQGTVVQIHSPDHFRKIGPTAYCIRALKIKVNECLAQDPGALTLNAFAAPSVARVLLLLETQTELNQARVICIADLAHRSLVEAVFRQLEVCVIEEVEELGVVLPLFAVSESEVSPCGRLVSSCRIQLLSVRLRSSELKSSRLQSLGISTPF